jgi:hypothetical protein
VLSQAKRAMVLLTRALRTTLIDLSFGEIEQTILGIRRPLAIPEREGSKGVSEEKRRQGRASEGREGRQGTS